MWGLLAAIGSVGLLVRTALTEKSDDPVLRPALQRRRLAKILTASRRRRLTRTEAEDGLVLARRLGEDALAEKFREEVKRSRTKQSGNRVEKTGRGLDDSRK
jgi:hypothetical protein